MSLLIADCPRCGSKKITFDVKANVFRARDHGWRDWHEVICVCRHCERPTIFLIRMSTEGPHDRDKFSSDPTLIVQFRGSLNQYFEVDRYISLRDQISRKAPEHLPDDILRIFNEAAACLSIGCSNAAATMFRLCLDLATRPLLPDQSDATRPQPNSKTRRDLGLRLQWLFDNSVLPGALRDLAKCIREDANDGAHVGDLTQIDAEDVADLTAALLSALD